MLKRQFLFWLALLICPVCAEAEEEITVAAAANLQFTLEEMTDIFQRDTGIKVKTILGSSGKLTAQIQNGAPYDIFMSADEDYPRRLYQDGKTIGEPKVYAYGSLVLWTMKDIDLSQGAAMLRETDLKKIAVASDQPSPYGRQAVKAMEYFQLYPDIAGRLVFGESIAQVNQFITTQAADIGFTAKSVVLAANMQNKGRWVDVDPRSYQPIAQSAVMLSNAQRSLDQAQKFFDFLFSDQARGIFRKYGYQ